MRRKSSNRSRHGSRDGTTCECGDALEAILYATDQPVTIPQIASLLRDAKMEAREEEIARIVADLAES